MPSQETTMLKQPQDLAHSVELISLQINERAVQVPEGTSVLEAARQAGINIPKLCASEALPAFGSCRLCLVGIEGERGYKAAYTTPVRPNKQMHTHNGTI